MLETEAACIALGIRAIDTRHEQAAALAGARLDAGDAAARRLHGLLGPGRDQPAHRRRQRLHRRRAARRHRRVEPARLPRHGGLPGDRPGRGVPARHQVGGAHLRRQAHPRHGARRPSARPRRGVPAPSISTCRATSWARRSTRASIVYPARVAARRRARSAIPRAVPRGHRAAREGRAPGRHRGQRRVVVRRRGRAPGLRRGHGHPLLHHADLARPDPGRPRAGLPERARARPSPRPTSSWRWARASTGSSSSAGRRASPPTSR